MPSNKMLSDDVQSQYDSLTADAGFVDLSGRTQIEMTGADAVSFLQNLCTNDIQRLVPGSGCEAFLTSVQGKILSHVLVFRGTNSIVLDTSAGQGDALTSHLDRYIIREDVQLCNRTDQWDEILVAGSKAEKSLLNIVEGTLPEELLGHCRIKLAGQTAWLRRVDFTRPCSFVIASVAEDKPAITQALQEAGVVQCDFSAFDIARVEAGTPFYGQDISIENLPQEVAREEKTISFTKGCYLGQETVSRIDALGHVNRTLVGLKLSAGEIPASGTEIVAEEKSVGKISSAVYSPKLECPLALAYVHRHHHGVGTKLACLGQQAEVISLPLD